MVRFMYDDLKEEWVFGLFFLIISLLYRCNQIIEIMSCNGCALPNNANDQVYIVIYRLCNMLFYYYLQRASIKLCDIKYYHDSDWFKEKSNDRFKSIAEKRKNLTANTGPSTGGGGGGRGAGASNAHNFNSAVSPRKAATNGGGASSNNTNSNRASSSSGSHITSTLTRSSPRLGKKTVRIEDRLGKTITDRLGKSIFERLGKPLAVGTVVVGSHILGPKKAGSSSKGGIHPGPKPKPPFKRNKK